MMELMKMSNPQISACAAESFETMDTLCQGIRPYMRQAGIHAQCNIVDTETMRRAQESPEEYRDLVVRIGGFSAYFVQLSKTMQDDVIMRTEQAI